MRVYKEIIVLILCSLNSLSAQSDSLKKDRIYINCSLILNRAYSQFEKLTGNFGHSGYYEKIIPLGNEGLIKPGMYLSLNRTIGKKIKRKFMLGAALSITQNHYKHIIHNPIDNFGAYTGRFTDLDVDTHERMFILNGEIGTKRKLSKRLYTVNTLVLHLNLMNTKLQKGNITTTTYASYPSGSPYAYLNYSKSEVSPVNTKTTDRLTVNTGMGGGVSYRLALSYKCFINKHDFDITAFRNFSLQIRFLRPWWGFGLNFYLQ